MRAGTQEFVGRRDGEDEAGADRLQIEGGAMRHAERRLDLRRGGRKSVIRRRRRDDDEVDVRRRPSRLRHSRLRRLGAQRRGRLALAGDVPPLDASALDDPVVARVDDPREIVIGDRLLRQGAADAPHDRA